MTRPITEGLVAAMRNKSILLIVLLIGLPPFVVRGQNPVIDSLKHYLGNSLPDGDKIEAYNILAWELADHDTSAARSYANKALKLARENNDTTGQALAYNRLGRLAYFQGSFSTAMDLYNKNLALRLAQKDTSGIASTYLNMGNVYNRQGEYAKALDLFYKGLKFCESSTSTILRDQASLHGAIGYTLLEQGNRDKGEEHFLQALFYSKKSGIKESMASAYLDMGNFHARGGDLKRALANYEDASAIMERIGDKTGLAAVWNSMGNTHLQKEEYKEARLMYSKSIALRKEVGDAHGIALGHNSMGTSYAWEGLHKEALTEFDISARVAREAGLRDDLARALENKSYSYEALGEYKKAFLTYYSFDSISNIILNEASNRHVNELQVQYDTEKKERQIESLQQKEALQKAEAQKRNTQIKALIAGLVLFIGLGAALVFAYRQKQKANRLLNEQKLLVEKREKEKELLLRELNHRVKNNLQVIASMLSLQSFQLEDQKAVEAVKEGQSRVEAMFLIHERLYRDDQVTHIDMDHYIKQLLSSISYSFGYTERDVKLQTEVTVEPLVVDIAIPLGLIINELITNAFKHAFKEVKEPELRVSLKEEEGQLKLTLLDNGPGIPEGKPDKASISFGMEMIRSLLKQLRGELKTTYKSGSCFEITLPLSRTA
ncbi:MAG TPA: hypothetical protein DCG19_07145 [Cryomorphaceae bacterium]|nr:hypothetical protein [Owenweeksia sp.]MBF97657.1 hypothetical protein [Owenweeksia sp.]HAD97166.1 hypothetical protein [Cryomorphaceae bacterium]HBF21296.1 hypothetical protein [Cryomorphaceae bacterium]